MPKHLQLGISEPLVNLLLPHRYKVLYGGRGGGKSWAVARCLIAKAYESKILILCTRQYQASIADSVHKLLSEQIYDLGLSKWFDIGKRSIKCLRTDSEFIFKGLFNNTGEIRSTEGVDICWAEEAHSITEEGWMNLIPTIRKKGSEIWVTFNPQDEYDSTYQRFVTNHAILEEEQNAFIRKVSWRDNPGFFGTTMDDERRYLLRVDRDAYQHVWEGECKSVSEATIFRNKFVVEQFEAPEGAKFYYGADWGFSHDPTVLIRCYQTDNHLYIDHEAYGIGVELDGGKDDVSVAQLFDRVPGSRTNLILADSARPETISFVKSKGFIIGPAEKWKGSVEDGISHLRAFEKIHIHERCTHTAQEARLYSYKVHPKTELVLTDIVDAHNHCWDSVRYALNDFICRRGAVGVWRRLVA